VAVIDLPGNGHVTIGLGKTEIDPEFGLCANGSF